jgi:acetolactate synthase-1/2/3 large subunit
VNHGCPTAGAALIGRLKAHGVELVFGIPGVHTVELYRGIEAHDLRHVTPRHEQGAGFMADGYARVSGRPGVALVITGPGLTNALTAMAQARADSIPILVISGVNARDTLGRGLGFLHELPDQRALAAQVTLESIRVEAPAEVAGAVDRAFTRMTQGRPGPVHIEVPLDVMTLPAGARTVRPAPTPAPPVPNAALLDQAAELLAGAERPLILAGGGARRADVALRDLAERLGAPVMTTVNGRGLMHGHTLNLPISPSLRTARVLIAAADRILAVGTELGPTDYDMYGTDGLPSMPGLIRVDIDPAQLARHPAALTIAGDAAAALGGLAARIAPRPGDAGAWRAGAARAAAWAEIGPKMRDAAGVLDALREALPGAILVGDSTQPVYAGNLAYDHDRPGGWFNSATGYGTLGYAPAAAIGAALADPKAPVVCIVGDGGFQFSIGELATAVEEGLPVIFLIWNNRGYREIAHAMAEAAVRPIGVDLFTPDFRAIAKAYDIPFSRPPSLRALISALNAGCGRKGPSIIEWVEGAER